MLEHGVAQCHAVPELLGGDATPRGAFAVVAGKFARLWVAAEVGMAFRAEPVEGTAHVHILPRVHVEECQVYGGAACVSALLHDILLLKEHALVQVGIEVWPHLRRRAV